jgi:hypothetical protein
VVFLKTGDKLALRPAKMVHLEKFKVFLKTGDKLALRPAKMVHLEKFKTC